MTWFALILLLIGMWAAERVPCPNCGDMTSCAQAQLCLLSGETRLDRDRDGVPWEPFCR